jgi:uncharacterized membrane protein YidH (DUF202 family)
MRTSLGLLAGGIAILGVLCVLVFVKPIESTRTPDAALALH